MGLRRLAPHGPPGRPVLLIPGFGNNAHLYTLRNDGPSWLEALAADGLDPWALDLRQDATFDHWVHTDLPAAVAAILRITGHRELDLVGCSLGGLLAYTWLASAPAAPVGRVVAVGTPLLWHQAPPVVRAFRAVGGLTAGWSPGGSRGFARRGLPLLQRLGTGPLGFYLNVERLSPTAAQELPSAVVDPGPALVRTVHHWVRTGEPWLGEDPLVPRLASLDHPLLLLTGDRDGIAPTRCCTPVLGAWGGRTAHVEVRGGWGHVDLFVARGVHEQVLPPILRWLREPAQAALGA